MPRVANIPADRLQTAFGCSQPDRRLCSQRFSPQKYLSPAKSDPHLCPKPQKNTRRATLMENAYPHETMLLRRIYGILTSEGYSKRYTDSMRSDSALTRFITEIVDELARQMGLKRFSEYYTIDHVLYGEGDSLPEGVLPFGTSKVSGTWLRRIRVAFEHENRLDAAGGFQEVAKLMLINADLKVLMGYGNKGDDYDAYAKDYQQIFSEVTIPTTPILFIGEYLDGHVDAYLITSEGLLKYDWGAAMWITPSCANSVV